MGERQLGISGLSVNVPPYRVDLESWCQWTGNPWEKIRTVVGRSFRMRGPEQNVYTMAANAVLSLLERFAIAPAEVGFLGLGTESSTDNSAGAVIVKGMVDRALQARGQAPLARDCEVPEFKQACLGGVYALKGALRYLACDGAGRKAITVSADVAEYARGSSGEPTQGAGAVAVLLESNPRLVSIDLARAGSASDYRGVDFRKPMTRFCQQRPRHNGQVQDLPVFNGKYSTTCYVDETLHAMESMFAKRGGDRRACFHDIAAVVMHRPYRRMPINAWALAYLSALAHSGVAGRQELAGYCDAIGADLDALLRELHSSPDVAGLAEPGSVNREAYPLSMRVLKVFRDSDTYGKVVEGKMQLGADLMMELGNIYSGALFAWLGAGFEDALENRVELADKELVAVGYGSGDAADAIPMRVVPGWQDSAARIRFREALLDARDLSREQYESLHDGRRVDGLGYDYSGEFVVERVGDRNDPEFQDAGIEYYRFVT